MKFYVQGMHCPSCVMLTEGELGDLPQVKQVKADLATRSVTVEGDFQNKTSAEVAAELSKPLIPYGYTLTLEPGKAPVRWKDFYVALPIALGFILLFVVLQKLGVVHWVQTGQMT